MSEELIQSVADQRAPFYKALDTVQWTAQDLRDYANSCEHLGLMRLTGDLRRMAHDLMKARDAIDAHDREAVVAKVRASEAATKNMIEAVVAGIDIGKIEPKA